MSSITAPQNLLPDTFLELWIELQDLKRLMEEATGRYRAQRKRLDKAGVNMKSLALVEQFAKLEDDEAQSRLRQMLQLAGWLKLPIGTQGALFDEPAKTDAPGVTMTAALTEQEARQSGYEGGKRGDDRDENPYDNGTPLFAAWDKGYLEGQRFIADAMARGDAPRPNKPRRNSAARAPRAARGNGRSPSIGI